MKEQTFVPASPAKTSGFENSIRTAIPPILRIEEAAAVLTVSRRTVAEMLARGTLKSIRIGRRRVVTREALEKLTGTRLSTTN